MTARADLVRYLPGLRGFLARLAGGGADVDDLVQETMIKASRAWEGYRGEAAVSTWLFAIAVRVFVDHRRARARERALIKRASVRPSPHKAPANEPEASASRKEMIDCIGARMERLPERYRRLVILKDIEGRSIHEIAAREGVTLGAARTGLTRARAALRAILLEECAISGLTCEPKKKYPVKAR